MTLQPGSDAGQLKTTKTLARSVRAGVRCQIARRDAILIAPLHCWCSETIDMASRGGIIRDDAGGCATIEIYGAYESATDQRAANGGKISH
jgi:hypothetical protein